MGFFDNKKNVLDYIKMAKGYDGKNLINKLKPYLTEESSILELGMGPGVDLNILKKYFNATGSDSSKIFLDLYLTKNPQAELLKLDAVTIDTNRKFDCLYSNKVLHHLTKTELESSLKRQNEVLNKNGIAFHSFWKGEKTENYDDLFFQYYLKNDLKSIIEPYFEILEMKTYSEMDKNDSIYTILKNSK